MSFYSIKTNNLGLRLSKYLKLSKIGTCIAFYFFALYYDVILSKRIIVNTIPKAVDVIWFEEMCMLYNMHLPSSKFPEINI